MGFSFDPVLKKIILTSTDSFSVRDLYTAWKAWVPDHLNLTRALRPTGNEDTGNGKATGATFFIANDWQIVPFDSNHTLLIEGNLRPETDNPTRTDIFAIRPGRTINILLERSLLSETIEVTTTPTHSDDSDIDWDWIRLQWQLRADQLLQLRKAIGWTSISPEITVPPWELIPNISGVVSPCSAPVNLFTFDRSLHGLRTVAFHGNGREVTLEWHKTYCKPSDWKLVYNIYWSSTKHDVFSDGVKLIAANNQTQATVSGNFKVGDMYYFAVKAAAHEPDTIDFDQLPRIGDLRFYPNDVLREDISSTDLIIPINDASLFPETGIIILGAEIIAYSSVDFANNNLILSSIDQRGIYGYQPRPHTVEGYDGIRYYENPFVRLWCGFEDQNVAVGMGENKFSEQYARTITDGYRNRVDILTGSSSLDVIDNTNAGFLPWDNRGWGRTYLPDLLAGKCVGSYFGGEYGCADGYESTGSIRGLSVQDYINMREEYLLENTGRLCSLFKRMWKGKQSQHVDSARENTAYRGLDTYGTSLVTGYEQFFNPRRSDGRVLVRFGPTKEDLKREESGIENSYVPNCWLGVIPVIQDGDFLIRYNIDGTEEWRYEIIDVERNNTLLMESGLQKFTAVRVRKTDPIYQVRAFRDTSMYPSELLTSISGSIEQGQIPLHMHRLVVNETITSLNLINQMTSIEQGHNHPIINGVISNVLGHTHTIILP